MEDMQPLKTVQRDDVVIYHPTENINLEVRVADDTVWLTQAQMAVLFGTQRQAITKHLQHIFEEQELEKKSTSSILEQVQKEGKRIVRRCVEFYNLDVIISVGFRVNTQKGIEFRKWANSILKEYMFRGYVLSPHLVQIEQRLAGHDSQISAINQRIDSMVQTALPPKAGLFYNGETFDAYVFVANLIREAKSDIKLVDNYIDETVLMLLSKRLPNVTATIYTERVTPQLQTDLNVYNTQYPNINLKTVQRVHDRFLIIDDSELYHFGASFKDLGKRLFMVSRIEEPAIVNALAGVFS
jgi:hypothetical protein